MTENPYQSPTPTPESESGAAVNFRKRRFESKQLQVNRLLNRGVVFSIIWLLGIGSVYSVFLATRAMRMIRRSNGELQGLGRVCWCYIVGGIGILLFGSILISVFANG